MARKIEVEITGDSSSLQRALSKAGGAGSKNLEKLGRAAKYAGAALAAGLVVGTVKAVGAASDLNESMNKATVVFGKQARAVLAWSKTTSNAFGISQAAALDAAAGFGGMFKAAGQAGEEAAKMSELFVKAAADLGSFFNVDPTQALEDLRSGLAGESEPLRKFNIFMNEATIKTYAYKKGIAEAGTELTENQKILARQGFILDHIGKASNDFAETSDSLANVQRRLRGQFEDLAASLGMKVLPVIAEVGDKFSDFINRFSRAKGFEAKLRVTWLGAKEAVTDLYNTIQDALFGARKVLHMNSQTVVWETPGLLKNLQSVLEDADWTAIGRTIGQGISERVRVTAEFMNNALTAIADWVDSHLSELGELGVKLFGAFVVAITDPNFWRKNWRLAIAVALAVFPVGRVLKLGGILAKTLLRGFAKAIGEGAAKAAESFIKVIEKIAEVIEKKLGGVLESVPKWVQRAFKITALGTFIGVVQKVIDKIKDLIGWIKDIGPSGKTIRNLLGPFGDVLGIIERVISALQTAVGWLGRLDAGSTSVPPGVRAAPQQGGGSALGGIVRRTGLEKVHAGEAIVPARVARGGHGSSGADWQLALVAIGPDLVRELQRTNARYARGNGGRSIW